MMWKHYHTVRTIDEAVELLAKYAGSVRIVAGATDLIIELEAGLRPDLHGLIDITRVPGLDHITTDDEGWIHLGPLVTHNHCAVSKLIIEHAYALARACWEVGAPQNSQPRNDRWKPDYGLSRQRFDHSPHGSRRAGDAAINKRRTGSANFGLLHGGSSDGDARR